MNNPGYVYIMASARNGTLYIGATSNLLKRVYEHREGVVAGFTRRHGCKLLVWYEVHATIDAARQRELQMKEWQRGSKPKLIERMNPTGTIYMPPLSSSPAQAGTQSYHLVARPRPTPANQEG